MTQKNSENSQASSKSKASMDDDEANRAGLRERAHRTKVRKGAPALTTPTPCLETGSK